MPRLTPLRILLCIPLIWSTPFLLYVFLPFPQVSQSSRADYIQHQLTHGNTLTTVIPQEGLYERASEFGNPGGLAIEWRLSLANNDAKRASHQPGDDGNAQSILLHIGKRATVNITDALHQSTATGDYESAPFQAHVIGGEDPEDKVIVPPWFPWAEGLLFDSADHYFEAEIGLKVKVVQNNMVEVWSDPHFINKPYIDRGSEPIYSGAPRETGLLAAFAVSSENDADESLASVGAQTVERRMPLRPATSLSRLVRVQHVRGGLLSRTFGIRQWLLRRFESPIFINFYVCALVLMPRAALEMSSILIVPLVICYIIIGFVAFVVLKKVWNGTRKLFRMGAEGSGGQARGSRVKLPAWMKDDGGVKGIVIGRRNRLLQQETDEEG